MSEPNLKNPHSDYWTSWGCCNVITEYNVISVNMPAPNSETSDELFCIFFSVCRSCIKVRADKNNSVMVRDKLWTWPWHFSSKMIFSQNHQTGSFQAVFREQHHFPQSRNQRKTELKQWPRNSRHFHRLSQWVSLHPSRAEYCLSL